MILLRKERCAFYSRRRREVLEVERHRALLVAQLSEKEMAKLRDALALAPATFRVFFASNGPGSRIREEENSVNLGQEGFGTTARRLAWLEETLR